MSESPSTEPKEERSPFIFENQGFWKIFILSFIVPAALIAAPYCVSKLLKYGGLDVDHGGYTVSFILLAPIIQGFILGWFNSAPKKWIGRAQLYIVNTVLISVLLAFFVDIMVAFLVMGEGVICIIITLPIFAAAISIGAFVGKISRRLIRKTGLILSLAPALMLLPAYEATQPLPVFSNAISDTVTINAPPEVVWKYIVQYPENPKPSDYWLWDMGLPMPTHSVAEKAEVGAVRNCLFTDGIVFKEEITELVPNKVLTFKVTEQPQHPEILGHFSLDKGQIYLEPNPDGTTTLIATSWYRIYAQPAKYFDWWAADITRKVHFRVLGYMKELAEADMTKQVAQ